ncbi:MAG: hypothetical protein LM563_06560 [Thermofilum sp.]|nr:hypothetical protein [Thermofilum sp.]
MSLPSVCVLDACFIIDWTRWSRRDLLWKVFSLGIVPEPVMREISTPQPLRVLREWMSAGFLTVHPSSRDLEDEALRLIVEARRNPRIPRIDPPEAVCVALARRIGAVVLSENRGVIRAYEAAGESLAPAIVWNSLRLLAHLYVTGAATSGSFEEVVAEYEQETKHAFSRREVVRVAREFGILQA